MWRVCAIALSFVSGWRAFSSVSLCESIHTNFGTDCGACISLFANFHAIAALSCRMKTLARHLQGNGTPRIVATVITRHPVFPFLPGTVVWAPRDAFICHGYQIGLLWFVDHIPKLFKSKEVHQIMLLWYAMPKHLQKAQPQPNTIWLSIVPCRSHVCCTYMLRKQCRLRHLPRIDGFTVHEHPGHPLQPWRQTLRLLLCGLLKLLPQGPPHALLYIVHADACR
jgi:hypothetical protein